MFGVLSLSWFSMKQFLNKCNQILGGKHVREDIRLHDFVK